MPSCTDRLDKVTAERSGLEGNLSLLGIDNQEWVRTLCSGRMVCTRTIMVDTYQGEKFPPYQEAGDFPTIVSSIGALENVRLVC